MNRIIRRIPLNFSLKLEKLISINFFEKLKKKSFIGGMLEKCFEMKRLNERPVHLNR
jgi:hypothetical protein